MVKRSRGHLASFVLLGMIGVAVGCTTSQDCSCADPTVTIDIPAADAAEIMSVTAGGVACSGVVATCSIQGSISCASYSIVPVAGGECDVTVTFSNGAEQHESYLFGAGEPTCCGDLSGGGEFTATPPSSVAVADGGHD